MTGAQEYRWSSNVALVAVVLLTAIGMVYATAAARPTSVDVAKLFSLPSLRQFLGLIIGFLVLAALARTPFARLEQIAMPLAVVSVLLLCAVWIPGLQVPTAGGGGELYHRRIGWGSLTIQPSEIAKLGMVLGMAAYCARYRRRIHEGKVVFWPLAGLVVACVLVEREPDFGTAIVLFLSGMTVLYIAGANRKHLGLFVAMALVAAAVMTAWKPYRWQRVVVWWDPEGHYEGAGQQIVQSLISFAGSGLRGVGFLEGEGRNFLPASNTDYIMAVIAEDWGLLGVGVVMLLLGVVVFHGARVALGSRQSFAQLATAGVSAILVWQSLINLAVVTNSIPCTGIPMPFISLGFTSQVVMLAAAGVLLQFEEHPADLPAVPERAV